MDSARSNYELVCKRVPGNYVAGISPNEMNVYCIYTLILKSAILAMIII
jgi:hypothetical protein